MEANDGQFAQEFGLTVMGEGRRVVFVHGFPLDRSMWEGQTPLAARGRLIRFNLPGFGGAPAGSDMIGASPSMGAYADHVIRVMDAEGCARAVLCGLSMGGYVLFEIWRRYPERVEALILSDTRAEPETPEGRDGRNALIALVRSGRRKEITDPMVARLLAASSQARPEVVEPVRRMMESASDEGLISALIAMRDRMDSRTLLSAIQVPVLILVGREDVLTPPSAAQVIHEQVKGSRLVRIPHAGHLAPLENPVAFNEAVGDFLGAV